MDIFARTEILLGDKNLQKLKNSTVTIVGVGGVGGYVCEFLVRAGIGNINIVDYDKIDVTNINRQIIATTDSVGENKVEVLKKRMQEINPNANINIYNEKLTCKNIEKIFDQKPDYIVDAIDDIQNKVELIKFAYDNDIKIISSMGVGNRYKMATFEVADIYKTQYDKLAKLLRKKLKEVGVKNLDVVYTKSPAEKIEASEIGSISYLPPMASSVLVCYVINRLIENG